jgi:hypothetical protein
MESFIQELPTANEGFLASRGPFNIATSLAAEACTVVLRLPFWTARETLKLFTELYLNASSLQHSNARTPSHLLQELIQTHSPYRDFELLKEAKSDSGPRHWAVVPKNNATQTLDELKVALEFSQTSQKSVVFTYESKKADVSVVLAGRVHRLNKDGFTLKSDWKYRSYLFEDVSRLSVVNGRSALHGVPTLHLYDRKPEDGGLLTVELGTMIPWHKL